ncbi:hypothetical protein TVAG_072080 [Trichomonas vaginalis G3]|uniref:Uncharacterized protein n=1 Tax=Trichomonas vaginalis (strain ATCC PRA-98 / G3) TaxID=412133 RepID=A2D8B2_TRIV3|nr:hypothetical protein TVAGG3_1047300 [Trichomonas vaginalis G3]EAY23545.1 hypothetical protein TVAG_072080 [Trichomonas vaginalis G3]KAI5493967.1 hypothetical protein TVAGG3_1047300 [Trichomonas vaginalis G3]|eukprot:XP_001584531.1 hypothetical protein [Trichomonas vaginalis G3]
MSILMNDKLQSLLQQQHCSFKDVYDAIGSIDFTKAKLNQKSRVKLIQIVKSEVDSHPDNEATLNLLKIMTSRRNFINEAANDNFNIASICDTFLRISRNDCQNPQIKTAYILCVDCLVNTAEKLRAQIAASVCEYVVSNFKEDSADQVVFSKSMRLIISTIRGSLDSKPVFLSKLVDQDYKNIISYVCNTFDPVGQALAAEFLWRMLQLLPKRRSETEIKSLYGDFIQLKQISVSQFSEGIHNFLKNLNSEFKNVYNFNLKNLIVGGSTVSKTHWIYIGNDKIVFWISKDSEWKPTIKKPCDLMILRREDIRGVCQHDKYWCLVLDDHFDTMVECFTDEKKLIFFKPSNKSETESIFKIMESRFGEVNESSIIITPPKPQKKPKNSESKKVAETPKPKLREKKYDIPPPQTPNLEKVPVTPSLSAMNQQTGTSFIDSSSSSWSLSDSSQEINVEEEIPKVPKDRKFKPIRETVKKTQKESIFEIKKGATPEKQSKRIEIINEEINSAKKLLSETEEKTKTKQKKSSKKKPKEVPKKRQKEEPKPKKTTKKLSKKEKAKKLLEEEEMKKKIIQESSDDEIESPSLSDEDSFSDNYAPVISQSFDNTQIDEFDNEISSDEEDEEKISEEKVSKISDEKVTEKSDIREEKPAEINQIQEQAPKRTYAPQSWELEAFAELKNFGQSIRQKLNDKHNEINKVIESSTENAINDVCKFTTECEENLELMRSNFDDASSATYTDIQNKQKMVKELGQQQREHIEQMRNDCAVLKKRAAEMIKRFEQQKTQLLQNQEKHIALFREDIRSEVRTAVSQKRREFSKSKVQKLVNLLEEL